MKIVLSFLCFVSLCCCLSYALADTASIDLVDSEGHPVTRFVGVFYVDTGRILVQPRLRASIRGSSEIGLVCGFRLSADSKSPPLPIDVRLRNPDGEGQFFARHGAVGSNASLGIFNFNVTAFDCNKPAHESKPTPVSMRGEKFATPKFRQEKYAASVPADAPIGTEVARVRATQSVVGVCAYALGENGEFDIDGVGIVRTRADLTSKSGRTFRLLVTATDCDVPEPKSATVALTVQIEKARQPDETCKIHWKGLPSKVDYEVASGQKLFASEAALQACELQRMTCQQKEATLRVSVRAAADAKCDRSNSALEQQMRLCGVNRHSLNLLATGEASNFCPADSVHVFAEASRPVDVHEAAAGHLGKNFTLHFWLKHGKMRGSAKEQILCSADSNKHNRHHYSVFLHNCKLVLLVRSETPDAKNFLASEWRFKASQVCDSQWHHYGLVRWGERVRLLIDGEGYDGEPEVLEDGPMHAPADTRTSVGACWHALKGQYSQPLIGQLAGLTLLPQEAEPLAALACLSSCSPSLSLRFVKRLPPGASVSLSADSSVVEAAGDNSSVVVDLLRQVALVATAVSHDVELKIETAVLCKDSRVAVSVPDTKLPVSLLSPRLFCLSGRGLGRASVASLASTDGVELLPDLGIQTGEKLLACSLRTTPDFTAVESLVWPAGLASDFGIEGRLSDHSHLLLEGGASASEYQRLLRLTRYRNTRPVISYRTFSVSCSSGNVSSNQLVVNLVVFRESSNRPTPTVKATDSELSMADKTNQAATHELHRQQQQQQQQHQQSVVVGGHFAKSHAMVLPHSTHHGGDASGSGGLWAVAPALIGVLTFGLVLTVVSLAIYRFRCRSQQQQRQSQVRCRPGKALPIDAESQEMEWDNAGLSITVNPLDEQDNLSESGSEANDIDYIEDELDLDGSSSCPDDDDDLDGMTATSLLMQRSAQIASSEDELEDEVVQLVTGPAAIQHQQQQRQQQQQLEWDDSILPSVRQAAI